MGLNFLNAIQTRYKGSSCQGHPLVLSLGWIQGLKVVQLYLFTEPFSWEQTLAVLYSELKHAQQRTTISIQDILYARERKCRPIRVWL